MKYVFIWFVHRSHITPKHAKKLWTIEFNNYLSADQPKIFVVTGGKQFSIYECPANDGNIKLQMHFVDPDVSRNKSTKNRLHFIWYFICYDVCGFGLLGKRGFLVMLLVCKPRETAFNIGDRWRTGCYSYHWARIE